MVTQTLAAHIAAARQAELPPPVRAKARLHVLDTLAAMVSGCRLPAGLRAVQWLSTQAAAGPARMAGTRLSAHPQFAALANGVLAHADETDDSHAPSLTHPGCAVVPAALTLADAHDLDGDTLLRAVVTGYDVGTRVARALGGERYFDRHHSSHAVGGLFGATAAASVLMGFDARRCAYMLAYAVQQASGNACWRRDPDHIEKAFDFGGMPAQQAVLAASLVAAGFTGSREPLEGVPGLFAAHAATAEPALAVEGLGSRYAVMETAIKKWCVGSPIQAALDSLQHLMAHEGVVAAEVERIVVALPRQAAPVVDRRDMPAVNLQHQLALLLIDGTVGFESGHDLERMHDPTVLALGDRISIDARVDDDFTTHPRQAIVTVYRAGAAPLSHHTRHVRGTPGNPMGEDEVHAKARDLMTPVIGPGHGEALLQRLADLEAQPSVRGLVDLLQPGPGAA